MSRTSSSSSEELDLDEIVNNEYKKRAKRHRKKRRQRFQLTPVTVVQLYLKSITNALDDSSNCNFLIFNIVEQNTCVLICRYIGNFPCSVAIPIGQCGINIALDASRQYPSNTPTTFYIDMEPRQYVDELITNSNSSFGTTGLGNNFAKGLYTNGPDWVAGDKVMERIRRHIEKHDTYSMHSIEVVHSIGGGTGSGLSAHILQQLKDMYYGGKFTISCFTIFPSPKVSDIVVEPYNAVLWMQEMKDSVDQVFAIDNECLFRYVTQVQNIRVPRYGDLNNVANAAINATRKLWNCPQSGWNARDVHKELSLRSHKELKYFGMSTNVPVKSISELAYCWDHAMKANNFLVPIAGSDLEEGRFMKTICALHVNDKCKISSKERKQITKKVIKAEASMAIDDKLGPKCHFNPTFIESEFAAEDEFEGSVSMLAHHTGIVNMFERVYRHWMKMLKRRAFLHWYRGEGMDMTEFETAQENLENIIQQYHSI